MKTTIWRRGLGVILGALVAAGCVSPAKRRAVQLEKDPQYQYEKAVVCMQYNMVDEAYNDPQAALALNPRHALALNLQGLAHMLKGNFPEAIKSFEATLAVDPNFSEGHNNLGTAYQESKRLAEATASYQKAYSLDGNYNASYNLAKISYTQGRLPEALDWIQKSIASYSRSVLAFNLQGLIFDGLERLDEAIASYQQALRVQPSELNVQYNLGVAYFKRKDNAKAKEIMTKILAELVKNPRAGSDDLRGRVQDVLKRLDSR